MPEESHLEEMSAAIRAQRERQAAPRAMISTENALPPQDEATPAREPEAERRPGLVARLLGR